MKPILLILAAGLSSRYGAGSKQTTAVGPNGEILMDYSIHAAVKAGFEQIVLVVQPGRESELSNMLKSRHPSHLQFTFACQETADIPVSMDQMVERRKPWGTGQAVWAARKWIDRPFLVINADDYYGQQAFQLMYSFLQTHRKQKPYAMVGFQLKNTLSRHGGVSRGICQVEDDELRSIGECHSLALTGGEVQGMDEDGRSVRISSEAITSMNFWGLQPEIFQTFEKYFTKFYNTCPHPETDEFYLPAWIQGLIQACRIRVRVIESREKWLGITYAADRDEVIAALRNK